ncbi:OmpA family protein [Saccharothrix longispora]|uniref:Outer membrane protein OmpA-like peptidoglycan-associated protein n=1 Tax=Saccharothrix longispora TaxID=33920 RepID=A0ABU1Q2Y3_9PSEU|nr:OmpA family protein [Saccharothrix longispora]MDR6597255.1 outer membrane protein OmpA-like peptidoglycan-associated protein [Saccharothrix longispora]
MNHSRLFAAVVLVAACAACGEDSGNPTTVRIGVTASANEPRVGLTTQVTDRLTAALARGQTRVVVYREGEDAGTAYSDEVLSAADDAEVRERLFRLDGQLAQIGGTTGRLDPLSVLADMASAPGPALLVLHSSGLQTTDPLDLTRLGLDLDVDAAVAAVPDDALPALTGKDVVFSGLGQVAGPQPPLPPGAQEALVELWLGICREFDAASCTHDPGPAPAGGPIARGEVPVVDLGQVENRDALVHVPSSLVFKAGGDELAPGAEDVLRQVAEKFDGRTTARVVVRTATSASAEQAADLTRRRAQRVVSALVDLGVSRSAFVEVVGAGFGSPLDVDLDAAGDLVPGAAARNRSVVVELVAPRVSG